MAEAHETVLILGASNREDRYAFKALEMLLARGHRVIPVHPRLKVIQNMPVLASVTEVEEPVDTVTLYVNPAISEPLADELVVLRPRRVIMNPGTESGILRSGMQDAGIVVEEACTLVLLSTEQF